MITSLIQQSGQLGHLRHSQSFFFVGVLGMEQGLMNVESLYFVYLWLYLFSSQTFVLRKQKHLEVLLDTSLLSLLQLSYFLTSDERHPLNHDPDANIL